LFNGTLNHVAYHRGPGVDLVTKNLETGSYQVFSVVRLSNFSNRSGLLKGQPIELSHLAGNVLTCRINGIEFCAARCWDAASCIKMQRLVSDKTGQFFSWFLFSFAAFFAVWSFAEHLYHKRLSRVRT